MTASLTALQLTEKYRNGELSPVDAARDALAAIERVDGHLNAICRTDPEATLRRAREAQQRYRDGTQIGPIDGAHHHQGHLRHPWSPTRRGSRLLPTPGADDRILARRRPS